MNIFRLVLITGAATRLTRLTTRDTLTAPLRQAAGDRLLFTPDQRAARALGKPVPPPASTKDAKRRAWLHTLITCDWCAGFWWTAIVFTLAHISGKRGPRAAAGCDAAMTILTASYVLGWVVEHEEQSHRH